MRLSRKSYVISVSHRLTQYLLVLTEGRTRPLPRANFKCISVAFLKAATWSRSYIRCTLLTFLALCKTLQLILYADYLLHFSDESDLLTEAVGQINVSLLLTLKIQLCIPEPGNNLLTVEDICRTLILCMIHRVLTHREPEYLYARLSENWCQHRISHGGRLHFLILNYK
ncbi:hypothetical protein J6590_030969 [Homalodisca vitripennis]|nr:hypothetical protein J6590_030969 [Homalodisca vitripennis]